MLRDVFLVAAAAAFGFIGTLLYAQGNGAEAARTGTAEFSQATPVRIADSARAPGATQRTADGIRMVGPKFFPDN